MASNNKITLLNMPLDIAIRLPSYLYDIGDLLSLSLSCRAFRELTSKVTPQTILRLAAAKLRTFFHEEPYFLVCTVARQIGSWARRSEANEAELLAGLPRGIEFLAELALREDVGCGLTLGHIRRCLHHVIYGPDIEEALFHVAIYGELFGPDFRTFFNNNPSTVSFTRMLKVKTRVAYLVYCVPDEAYGFCPLRLWTNVGGDPEYKLIRLPEGPYGHRFDSNKGLAGRKSHLRLLINRVHSLEHWKSQWKRARTWEEQPNPSTTTSPSSWQETLLENVMQCQGLQGVSMMMSPERKYRERWRPWIEGWQKKIDAMEMPAKVDIMGVETHEYPDLWNDLIISLKILHIYWEGA
ncbi:hypothetical protein F5Y04DRAFT_292861 [Hypomontagnella monticulosa]|nr:hypothetical protein F5Y04DRAFT_292861 [Hypomontagnella monticulosa]